MADRYEITVKSHRSIYSTKTELDLYSRDLNVYFSVPESGTNQETGLCILIAGFSGEANSNVYKKMRDTFADKYNLVVLQCNYFGWEFMQNPTAADIARIALDKRVVLANLEETPENFADMGIMQAIDQIVAVLHVMNIMYENNMEFNAKKIILSGLSQGAYLAYVCNALAPNLFSFIIDNSAWIYPVYLRMNRGATIELPDGSSIGEVKFSYLAKILLPDKDVLSLPMLYRRFCNRCRIVSYHGSDDTLIPFADKKEFCDKVPHLTLHEISAFKVDLKVFRSTQHGLDADFLALFDYAMTQEKVVFDKSSTFYLTPKIVYQFMDYKYTFNYENIFPKITMEKV